MTPVPGVSSGELAARRSRGLRLQQEGNLGELPESRWTVLASFNADPLAPLLCEALERTGVYARIALGPFGQIPEQILNPASELYASRPDELLLVPAVEDLLAPLFERPFAFSGDEAVDFAQRRLAELRGWLEALLDRAPGATVYPVVLGAARLPAGFVLDPRAAVRGQLALDTFHRGLRELGRLDARVAVVDFAAQREFYGAQPIADPRLWYLARMRLNPQGFADLAELVARHARAYRGASRKVCALDLDQTLWGGVLGEDGLEGLELGDEGVALAYQDLQRELLTLHDAGVLLAICSKNNEADAIEAIEAHPGMVLRREHFAARHINWQDKASNLREIAEELNLGLDSFVFLDDDPAERDWVRTALPEVAVPELPEDPAERPAFVQTLASFVRLDVTAGDRQRGRRYREQKARRSVQASAASFEEFLATLEQQVSITRLGGPALARAAQMCQRTNQFNMTTRRYTVADLEKLIGDESVEAFVLALSDRYGNSGITGLSIVRLSDGIADLDVFLLSCRVLGRKIEDVLLAVMAERANARGARFLQGRYVETEKNRLAARFYADRGFDPVGEGVFRLDLSLGIPSIPTQIKVNLSDVA